MAKLTTCIGEYVFNEELVPSGFDWSGHCKSLESFKAANFLPLETNGHHILVCSDSNSVALGNYISEYIDKSNRIARTASFINDWMDYWCYLAWELAIPSFADLPEWVQDAVKIIFGERILFLDQWIILLDPHELEDKFFSVDLQERINKICHAAVIDHLSFLFEQQENLESIRPENEVDWIMAVYDEFRGKRLRFGNAEDLMANCISENSGSIAFGCPIDDVDDTDWIHEGVADSLYENYEEFEEAVIQAAEECRKVLRDKDAEDLSNLAHRMIKKALGEICVVYEADGKQVDVTFDVDIPNLIYTYLAEYVEIEIKHSKPSI